MKKGTRGENLKARYRVVKEELVWILFDM